VPADLRAICLKCLEADPADRYASAGSLADDLGRWQRGEPVVARPVGAAMRLMMWSRRRPAMAALATLVGVSLVVVAALLLVGSDALRRERNRAVAQEVLAVKSAAKAERTA